MTIGDRIKKKREERRMSQTALAEKIFISKQTLYKYENNIITNIPSDKIELLAKQLKTTPAYLMGWDEIISEPENEYQLFKSLLERQDIKFSYIGTVSPIDKKNESEFYMIVTSDETCYKISVQDYHALKRDIDSFVKFKISEYVIDDYKIKPISENKKDKSPSTDKIAILSINEDKSHLEPVAAHDRTDIEVTDEMKKQDKDFMMDPKNWKK